MHLSNRFFYINFEISCNPSDNFLAVKVATKMKISKALYRTKEWKEFRLEAIEHAGDGCESCGRLQSNGAILQVHHIRYIRGRNPWEYGLAEVTVLCKGCHAEVHEKIMATSNWCYAGETDRGQLDGICDFCGNDIRYEHHLDHSTWGSLSVGTVCSDFLTETKEATDKRKLLERKSRFLSPRKWQPDLPQPKWTRVKPLLVPFALA